MSRYKRNGTLPAHRVVPGQEEVGEGEPTTVGVPLANIDMFSRVQGRQPLVIRHRRLAGPVPARNRWSPSGETPHHSTFFAPGNWQLSHLFLLHFSPQRSIIYSR